MAFILDDEKDSATVSKQPRFVLDDAPRETSIFDKAKSAISNTGLKVNNFIQKGRNFVLDEIPSPAPLPEPTPSSSEAGTWQKSDEIPSKIDRYVVNPIKAAKASIKQGAGGILQSIGESMADTRSPAQQISDTYGLKLPEDIPALRKSVTPEFITKIGEKVAIKGKDIVSQTQETIESLTPKEDAPYAEKLAFKVLHNLGVNVPGLAASIITKRPMSGLGFLGGVSYGEKYATERKRGASIDDAHTRALGEAGSEIGTEYIPISILIKPGLSIGKRIVQTVLSELVGENINTAYSLMQDKANYKPDKPFGDFIVQDLMPAFAETSTVAGISSLIMGAGAHPFVRKLETKPKSSEPIPQPAHGFKPTSVSIPETPREKVKTVVRELLNEALNKQISESIVQPKIEQSAKVEIPKFEPIGEKPVSKPISAYDTYLKIFPNTQTDYKTIGEIYANTGLRREFANLSDVKVKVVDTPGMEENKDAMYDDGDDTIYIRKGLSKKRFDEAISHELLHGLKLNEEEVGGALKTGIFEKPKGVIASEETKGQEAQESLPLKAVSFISVEDARSWIKQKSKEYGGRNQFLASKEYEEAYPEVKRVFDEQKQKEKEIQKKAGEVKIVKLSESHGKAIEGKFAIRYIQPPSGYVASGGGLYGGIASYNTEAEAIEKANKLGLTIVPEQGTSPETKGLPTGEVATVVSKGPYLFATKEEEIASQYKPERWIDDGEIYNINLDGKIRKVKIKKQLSFGKGQGRYKVELLGADGQWKHYAAPILEEYLLEKVETSELKQSSPPKETLVKSEENVIDKNMVEKAGTGDIFTKQNPEPEGGKRKRWQVTRKEMESINQDFLDTEKRLIEEYEKSKPNENYNFSDVYSLQDVIKKKGGKILREESMHPEGLVYDENNQIVHQTILDYEGSIERVEYEIDGVKKQAYQRSGRGDIDSFYHEWFLEDRELSSPEVYNIFEKNHNNTQKAIEELTDIQWKTNEIIKKKYGLEEDVHPLASGLHKYAIEQALLKNENIPQEVLKDYPELQQTHTMPSGEVMPGAEHKETLTKEEEKNAEEIRRNEKGIYEAGNVENAGGRESGQNLQLPTQERAKTSNERNEIKTETSATPISPIEAKIKKGIQEGESLYFTFNKAKKILSVNPKQLTDEQLQKHIVTLRDYERYVNNATPDNTKRLMEGEYFKSAQSMASTGMTPKDAFMGQNLRTSLDEAIKEKESRLTITSRKQLAEQMKQAGMSDEEVEINIQLAVDAPAKALGITSDEFIQSYVGQVKKSTMDELEGKDVTYQPSGLPDDVVAKIETSLINNVFDDSISTNSLRRYGKPHFVTISATTPKQEAWTRLRKVLIDNPKGYDIVGGRIVLTDKEYLEGKRNKVQYQGDIGAEKMSAYYRKQYREEMKREAEIKERLQRERRDDISERQVVKEERQIVSEPEGITPRLTYKDIYKKDVDRPIWLVYKKNGEEIARVKSHIKDKELLAYYTKAMPEVGADTLVQEEVYLDEAKQYYQGNRGAIEFTKDGKAIIHILENADKSTFIHEMFHLYVDIMQRTPKLKAQLKILETWIGKPVSKWTVADNEKVAKGGEKYLWEGNAPTSALKAVFERFKTWLREVYKTAKNLDIKLSDDVRKMWDEWFGGKEVTQARKRTSLHKEILQEAKVENIFKQIKAITTNVKIDQSFFDHFDRSELIPIQRQSPGLFSNDKGMPLDEVADGLGISTDELADKLRNAISKKQDIELLTKQIKEFRPPVEMITVGDIGLRVGDKFKIHGEQYAVKEKDAEGNFLIEDGDKFIVDEFDKIPIPDEGSLKKGKYVQPKLLEGEKVDIKPKMETEVQGQKKMFADIGGYSELAQGKTEEKGKETEPPPPIEKPPKVPRPKELEKFELPELVELAKELLGTYPELKNNLGKALGAFYPGRGMIRLRLDLAKDPKVAELVLAHEIGHGGVDWLPEKTMARGNILGRIASFRDYLKKLLKEYPKSPNEILTNADRARFKKQALELAKEAIAGQKVGGVEILPAQILEIWNDIQGKEKNPDLYDFIVRLNEQEKKQILLDAIKGKGLTLPENVQEFKNLDDKKKEIYRKLIREEIVKRKLYEEEVIRNELKKLTQIWKPFNELKNSDFTKYRYSGKELYADAISVLLNNPKLLADTAPNFYKAFFSYLENKADFRDAYYSIVNEYKKGTIAEHRDELSKAMMAKGEEAFALPVAEKERRTLRDRLAEVGAGLKKEFVDKFSPLYDSIKDKKIRSQVRNSVEDHIYKDAERQYYMNEIYFKGGYKDILDNKISEVDLATYVKARRIIFERKEIFNPGGHNPQTAQTLLDNLEDKLGNEKYKVLENSIEKFWQVRKDNIVSRMRESGMYTEDLLKIIEENKYYVTFDYTHAIEARFGKRVTAKIYKQVGSLKEVANPYTATILKDFAILDSINFNTAKREAVLGLIKDLSPDIRPTEMVKIKTKDGWAQVPKESIDPRFELVIWTEGGKVKGYYLPKNVADAFDKSPIETWKAVRVLNKISQPYREIFTRKRPGFALFNIIKDLKSAIMVLPGANIHNLPLYQVKALKDAIEGLHHYNPKTQRLLKGKALLTTVDYTGMTPEDTQLERLQIFYGLKHPEHHNVLIRAKNRFLAWLNYFGDVSERTTKIAIADYLDDKFPGLPEADKMHLVRWVGSPAFLVGGEAKPLTNNILLFFNPAIQGWRIQGEAAKDHPIEYGLKVMQFSIIPKILMFLGIVGYFGDEIKKIYQKVSKYGMTNYTVIPIGLTDNGKAVSLYVPNSESDRFIGGIFWKIITGLKNPADILSLFDYTMGQFPGLNPGLSFLWDLANLITGQKIYDRFRGQPAIPDKIRDAKDMRSVEAYAKYFWNQQGLGIIQRFDTDNVNEVKSRLQKIIGYPIASDILGRFIRVEDSGYSSELYEAKEPVKTAEARYRLDLEEAISNRINGKPDDKWNDDQKRAWSYFIATSSNKEAEDRISRYLTKTHGTVLERALSSATSNAQKEAIVNRFLELEGKK